MEELLRLCAQVRDRLAREPAQAVHRRLARDAELREATRRLSRALGDCHEVHRPPPPDAFPQEPAFTAVTWNLERGKNYPAILRCLREHAELKSADFYLFTEVDWGMARSENRNIAADLGQALGYFAYFVPSYFNFTLGHGSERGSVGQNSHGLHGKALLSRYPLTKLRSAALPNAFNKLKSKEARLGQKRALIAALPLSSGKTLTLACAHLDAFSSPTIRARQLGRALDDLRQDKAVLLAGDWNTNTINSRHGPGVLGSVLRQVFLTGPQTMIRTHFPRPELKFDRPLFRALSREGFDFDACNEIGAGTYDLVGDDRDLGDMAQDQFPAWVVRWINRQIHKGGGSIRLKLDWFATRGLRALDSKVVRLQAEEDYPRGERPSDHHPVLLRFQIPG